ncbi:MAG: hypothetical protein KC731_02990 [Myxococcales bacterium]|nr:hypothetical protein [Myxococcales bacterium]
MMVPLVSPEVVARLENDQRKLAALCERIRARLAHHHDPELQGLDADLDQLVTQHHHLLRGVLDAIVIDERD